MLIALGDGGDGVRQQQRQEERRQPVRDHHGRESDPNGIIRSATTSSRTSTPSPSTRPTPGSTVRATDPLFNLVYGRLLQPQPDGSLKPDLAKAVTVVDKNTIQIVLRDGLLSSDGTPLDSNAVKASLERNLANQATGRPDLLASSPLKSIDVVSPTTSSSTS